MLLASCDMPGPALRANSFQNGYGRLSPGFVSRWDHQAAEVAKSMSLIISAKSGRHPPPQEGWMELWGGQCGHLSGLFIPAHGTRQHHVGLPGGP